MSSNRVKKEIYLDYAAATPLDERVKKAMESHWQVRFGNPYSIHSFGKAARKSLESARGDIAQVLGARRDEIIFTSGGTEANNLAILGVAESFKNEKRARLSSPHIISTQFEHSSVLEPLAHLRKKGFEITLVGVSEGGMVDIKKIQRSLRKETILVSVMYVNNEIGTIQQIDRIGRIVKDFRKKNNLRYPYFHTDASQAPRFLPVNVSTAGVDLLTLDGAKIYGPKGVGILFVKSGTRVTPLVFGGGRDVLRAGTENVPSAIGFAKALSLCNTLRKKEYEKIEKLRHYFIRVLSSCVPGALLNGDTKRSIPGIINVSFPGLSGEALLIALDVGGVFVSTASACSSTNTDISHVIMSLSKNGKRARGSLRFSIGRETTKSELLKAIRILTSIIKKKHSL